MLRTDKYIILDSKVILMDNAESTLFIPIVVNGVEQGELRIKFIFDEEKKDSVILKKVSEDGLLLICKNFKESSGRFTTEPISIASIGGKAILINLWSSLNGSDISESKRVRKIEYTLFMEM